MKSAGEIGGRENRGRRSIPDRRPMKSAGEIGGRENRGRRSIPAFLIADLDDSVSVCDRSANNPNAHEQVLNDHYHRALKLRPKNGARLWGRRDGWSRSSLCSLRCPAANLVYAA